MLERPFRDSVTEKQKNKTVAKARRGDVAEARGSSDSGRKDKGTDNLAGITR